MNIEKKRDMRALLVLFAASALLLLLFSSCSPLYPLNTWVDPNCYMTVARGMRAGLVPFRDLMEQKGPLLYFIHLLALLFSPDSFHGVYPIEVIAHTAFLFAAYKTARLFAKRGIVPVLVASLMILLNCYGSGDTAEAMCLPFMAWSFYDAMRYFADDERRMTNAALLRNGFFAGCVFWTKYSLLGLHFAWMAVIAIEAVVRERKIAHAVKMCVVFLVGMALSSLPWLVYFGLNGALGDMFDIYFTQNIVGYTTDDGFFYNVIHGFGNDALRNSLIALLVFAGFAFLLLAGGKKRGWMKFCALAMAACMAVLLYMGGRFRGYTFYVYAVFLPLFAAGAGWLMERPVRLVRIVSGMLIACMLLAFCGYELNGAKGKLGRIGQDKMELVQYRFAEEINKTDNPTLLNCGFLDGGFYIAADVIPTERWFCKLNVSHSDCFEAQSSAVAEGRVDYVVTSGNTLASLGMDDSRYSLAMEDGQYRLYRLEKPAK